MVVLIDLIAKIIIQRNVLSKTITSSSMEKDIYDQPVDSDIKQYDETRKLKTGRNGTWSMFILTILEKIKETRLKFSQGSLAVI